MRSLSIMQKNEHIRLSACFIAETVELSAICLVSKICIKISLANLILVDIGSVWGTKKNF
jgi:hypothetical protein